jgi:hypothetical protein
MALTIIGDLADLQRGVEVPESGVGILSFECRYYPEVSEDHQDNVGETDGRVVSSVPSREVTFEGETTGTGGIMAFTFLTACTFANDTDTFGGDGDFLLQEITEVQSKADWRKVRGRATANPNLSVGS